MVAKKMKELWNRFLGWLLPDCYNLVLTSDDKHPIFCGEGYHRMIFCNRWCKHLERI